MMFDITKAPAAALLWFALHAMKSNCHLDIENEGVIGNDKITGPLFEAIPRAIKIDDVTYTVFTANYVTYARTALILPIALFLRLECFWLAALCVMIHDLLDHVDGIVARIHKKIYGQIDDSLLGGFLDAICDKVVILTSLWSVIMVMKFSQLSWLETLLFLGLAGILASYEITIGIIRIQDYFNASFLRDFKSKKNGVCNFVNGSNDLTSVTAAVMVGKLKEKLESMMIAFLCIAQIYPSTIINWAGILGVSCLVMSIYYAHKSLSHKLQVRKNLPSRKRASSTQADTQINSIMTQITIKENGLSETNSSDYQETTGIRCRKVTDQAHRVAVTGGLPQECSSGDSSEAEDIGNSHTPRRYSLPSAMNNPHCKVDKVYTIGCFDLFHDGHIKLLERMRVMGKESVVGVHDSRSYYKLKNKYPIDSTQKRMLNVKRYADVVFPICSTDPSTFMTCIIHLDNGQTAMYARGDDMPDFPARQVVESKMEVHFFPYTQGVSSSQLRKDKFSHIKPDDNSNLSDSDFN